MTTFSPTTNPNRATSPANHPVRPALSPVVLPPSAVDRPGLEPRRASIQFRAHSNTSLPRGSPKTGRGKRRMSSPPPPPLFQPRVSFDTFDRPADFIEENSFTLITKHKDYEYTKRSRTFLCGCDDNEYSEYALQWLIDELVDDGDEIVCLRVVEKEDAIAGDRSVENGRYRSEAENLMQAIQVRNHENKAINLILEFAVGKVNRVIDEMINLYEPAILVVGTRGRSLGGFQGLLPGSVSKYCLQHSPVPVIVVRPSSKRDKARIKRAKDPNRHGYKDLLEKSAPQGGHPLGSPGNRNSFIAEEDAVEMAAQLSEDEEARAVAAAIGYKGPPGTGNFIGGGVGGVGGGVASPLFQVQNVGANHEDEDDDIDGLKSPAVLMKSPALQNLDSPELSEQSSSEEEEDLDDQVEEDEDGYENGGGRRHGGEGSVSTGSETLIGSSASAVERAKGARNVGVPGEGDGDDGKHDSVH